MPISQTEKYIGIKSILNRFKINSLNHHDSGGLLWSDWCEEVIKMWSLRKEAEAAYNQLQVQLQEAEAAYNQLQLERAIGGATPPADGGATPPADGGATPPADGGATQLEQALTKITQLEQALERWTSWESSKEYQSWQVWLQEQRAFGDAVPKMRREDQPNRMHNARWCNSCGYKTYVGQKCYTFGCRHCEESQDAAAEFNELTQKLQDTENQLQQEKDDHAATKKELDDRNAKRDRRAKKGTKRKRGPAPAATPTVVIDGG